nr:hypothetical protein [Ciceribacter naphthalenivorans]
MDELPPHDERTGQPVQPGPVRHRHHPLRNSQHRRSLLSLIAKVELSGGGNGTFGCRS